MPPTAGNRRRGAEEDLGGYTSSQCAPEWINLHTQTTSRAQNPETIMERQKILASRLAQLRGKAGGGGFAWRIVLPSLV